MSLCGQSKNEPRHAPKLKLPHREYQSKVFRKFDLSQALGEYTEYRSCKIGIIFKSKEYQNTTFYNFGAQWVEYEVRVGVPAKLRPSLA